MAKCLIWGTSAQHMPRLGDFEHLNSRRAGGEYKVPGSHLDAVRSLTEPEKKRLTTWIVSQHGAGIAVPEINDTVLDHIKRGRDMPFSERVDRALLFLGTRTKVGGTMAVDGASSQSREALKEYFSAFTETADAGEIQSLLKMLEADADSDEAGHAFQSEAGHLFRSEAGRGSDLMSATLGRAAAGRWDDVFLWLLGQADGSSMRRLRMLSPARSIR